MIDLLSVLSYLEVLNGQYTILSHRIDHYHAYDGTEGEEWIITMQNDYPVPRQLSCKTGLFLSDDRKKPHFSSYSGLRR